MKPSRDDVLRVAGECGLRVAETPVHSSSTIGTYLWGEPADIERFAAAMYAAGAEDMRERAANECSERAWGVGGAAANCAAAIRALPITPTNHCPKAAHMGQYACANKAQCWEPCGALGHSEEHCNPTNTEGEKA
jgi:hypothetical protein